MRLSNLTDVALVREVEAAAPGQLPVDRAMTTSIWTCCTPPTWRALITLVALPPAALIASR